MSDTPKDEAPPPIITTTRPTEGGTATDAGVDDTDWELFDAQSKAKELRALFSNRVFVQPDGAHLRVSFGERVGDETLYHTAMVIPNREALELGDLLVSMATASLEQQWQNVRRAIASEEARDPEGAPRG